MPNVYDASKKYTEEYGWVVHPLSNPNDDKNAPGKRPLMKGWSDLKQPLSEKNIDKHFKNKDVNIGLVCGEVSNITIVDIDDELFQPELMAGVNDLTFIMAKRTEGRGHLYFKHCSDGWLRNYEYDYIKIDIRNDNEKGGGGNIVLPPSVHNSGDVYFFNKDFNVNNIPEMPEQFKLNLQKLINGNTQLSTAVKKSRKWVREFLSNPEILHGRDGRRCMLALCAELKTNGFTSDDNGTMISKIVYRNDYDPTISNDQWRYVEPFPWKSDKLIAEFPEFCNDENTHGSITKKPETATKEKDVTFIITNTKKLKHVREIYTDVTINKVEHNGRTLYTCLNNEFLNFCINQKIIEIVEVKDVVLPIVDTIKKLESMIVCMEIKDGKQPIYYVKIDNNTLRFEPDELLNISKWREYLLANCKIVMGIRSKKLRTDFDCLIANLINNAHIIWNDVESDDEILVSIILEDLNKLVYVDAIEKLNQMEMSCYDDGETKFVKSSTILQIIQNRNIGLKIRSVREIMRPYLKHNSKQIRIGGERVSVWFFDSMK